MMLKRFVQWVRDMFSLVGLGFLVQYGLQTTFADSGNYVVRKHVVGCLILASAFAVAHRFKTESRHLVANENKAVAM